MVSGLKTDIAKQLLEQNVSSFSMAPVKVCSLIYLMSWKCSSCPLICDYTLTLLNYFSFFPNAGCSFIALFVYFHRGATHSRDMTYLPGRIMSSKSIIRLRYITHFIKWFSEVTRLLTFCDQSIKNFYNLSKWDL